MADAKVFYPPLAKKVIERIREGGKNRKLPRNPFLHDTIPQRFSDEVRLSYDESDGLSSLNLRFQNWFLDSIASSLLQWGQQRNLPAGFSVNPGEILYWKERPMASAPQGVQVDFVLRSSLNVFEYEKNKMRTTVTYGATTNARIPVLVKGTMIDYGVGDAIRQKIRTLHMSLLPYGSINHDDSLFDFVGVYRE